MSLERVIKATRRNGLDGIAVIDHNEIEGAKRLAEVAPFAVIVGEEVVTREGEVAGLFLRERIPPGLSLEETVARIKEQGGLVYATHPLARDAPKSIGDEALESIIDRINIIEGFNARIRHRSDNERAKEIARLHGIAVAAGSDAHFPWEIGRAGIEIAPFSTPQEFLENLRQAQIFGRRTPYIFAGLTYIIWCAHRLYRRASSNPSI
jgi:predicted metal-dependent phosphoesterase TrpH